MENIQHYIGYWKFSPEVTKEQIEDFAQEWAKDENYLSLHIRKASQNQYALGFEYDASADNSKESFDQYMRSMKDTLLKKFGVELVGWDVSSNYFKIK